MSARPVLDHGYVRLIETWGSGDASVPEAGIIEAARQSTQGSFRGWESDEKLLQFLYRNRHSTPFEFCGMTLEIQAPIFVFREWQRHRTQSYSEMSARYAPLPELAYMPSLERVMRNSTGNRQAGAVSGAETLTEDAALLFLSELQDSYRDFDAKYIAALAGGVPKELARCGMPVGRYSRMRASANLRNWLAFLTLRDDPAAQWEIQQFAKEVSSIVSSEFPRTYAAYAKGKSG